jgi:uncharacterized membrane protein HdeD (DUF308 family)
VLAIVIGLVSVAWPGIGALSLAPVFGLFSLFFGISALFLYFQTRQAAGAK